MAKQTDIESGEVKTSKTGKKPMIADAETELIDNSPASRTANPDETTLVGGLKSKKSIPTVGWLVVWEGEGQGVSHKLSPGRNTIGRGKGCDICVNHGDSTISKEGTVSITYEHKYHAFTFVNHGSKNPPYINDKAIHTECGLKDGDILEIGGTKLVFVPFCSPERNWS